MGMKKRLLPSFHLIRRKSAALYILITLLCFAASVAFTRLFLTLTGFPQIGKGELHIAHVLWGGALLYTSVLILLIFSDQRMFVFGSILAGVGVGLFTDEIGKFITQSNDYFFPVAAPLIYICFLVSLLVLLKIRHFSHSAPGEKLARILNDVSLTYNVKYSEEEWEKVKSSLLDIAAAPESTEQADLALAIIHFVENDPEGHIKAKASPNSFDKGIRRITTKISSPRALRILLIIGLFCVGLLIWKNPVSVLSIGWKGWGLGTFLDALRFGQPILPVTSPAWFQIRVGLEVVTGLIVLVSACLLLTKWRPLGVTLGILGLLVSLSTLDILLFYFEQFSTIITTALQFLILFGLFHYRELLQKK
jgi:hypothetical protein